MERGGGGEELEDSGCEDTQWAMREGMQATSRSWERQEDGFFPRPPERTQPANTLILDSSSSDS